MRKLSSASPTRGLSVVFKTANGRSLELNTEQQVKLIPAIAGIVAQITFESLKKFAPAIGAEILSKVHQVVRAADEGKTTDRPLAGLALDSFLIEADLKLFHLQVVHLAEQEAR